MELVYRITDRIGQLDRLGAVLTRLGLVIVTLWIGALKVTQYEAEGIVPFVRGIVKICGLGCFRRPPFQLSGRRLRAALVG